MNASNEDRKVADPSEPQRVWAVYENGRYGPELRSVCVTRTTDKRVYIDGRSEFAFGCRGSLDKSEACFAPEAALTAWRAKCDDRIVSLEGQLAEAVALRAAEVKS